MAAFPPSPGEWGGELAGDGVGDGGVEGAGLGWVPMAVVACEDGTCEATCRASSTTVASLSVSDCDGDRGGLGSEAAFRANTGVDMAEDAVWADPWESWLGRPPRRDSRSSPLCSSAKCFVIHVVRRPKRVEKRFLQPGKGQLVPQSSGSHREAKCGTAARRWLLFC